MLKFTRVLRSRNPLKKAIKHNVSTSLSHKNKRRNHRRKLNHQQKRQVAGKEKELKKLNRLIEESKHALATTSTSSISHLVMKLVVEDNQAYSAENVQMKDVIHDDKNIINQKVLRTWQLSKQA